MTDSYGREINYLRISVTDLCDLRCRYCMPADGVCKRDHSEMMDFEEIAMAVCAAAALGITKVRITGGEPLVKNGIVDICKVIADTDGIEEVCITTNGIKLPELAKPLRQAGVSRLNISLDTLNPDKFAYITRNGKLEDALSGIDAALNSGFDKIKLNAVLIGGFNDDEIEDLAALTLKYPLDMRFIEMMPMYDSGDFGAEAFIPYTVVTEKLPQLIPLEKDGSVAKLYTLPDALGNIGLISPVSAHFCRECNRIRLTSDGKLKPCLHSSVEFPVKGLSYDEMKEVFKKAIYAKPEWHGQLDYINRSKAERNMNEIGG